MLSGGELQIVLINSVLDGQVISRTQGIRLFLWYNWPVLVILYIIPLPNDYFPGLSSAVRNITGQAGVRNCDVEELTFRFKFSESLILMYCNRRYSTFQHFNSSGKL
jgi:hypothetical protein